MVDATQKCLQVPERSYVALAKKEIRAIAESNGFTPDQVAEIDLIVAEITSNLIKHANGGELLVRMTTDEQGPALEILSIDNGPGIADPVRMMKDGASTANTLGHGLGSINRMSDTFQIYSQKNWGTILLARKYRYPTNKGVPKRFFSLGTVLVPKPGELACGDGYALKYNDTELTVLLGDGLGHGEQAQVAVDKARESFHETESTQPVDIIRHLHPAVKKTRGLVATVANYHRKSKKWLLCGVGNISTKIQFAAAVKSYICYNGVIGMTIPNTMKDQEIETEHMPILIMCSDGIKSRWDTSKYPGIARYDVSILAAAIYKDFARRTDDMSVIVIKIN